MPLNRRALLSGLAVSTAFAGLARAQQQTGETYLNEVEGYGPLVPDPMRILDLPQGFSYRVLSQAGETMSDGLFAPYKFDGMGCLPLGGSKVALIRNHELKPADRNHGPLGLGRRLAGKLDPAKAYDLDPDGDPLPGGTTTLIYNLKRQKVERQFVSLAGTSINCAGGITPWGSWLTCEETVQKAGKGVGKDHGWVFEVPARARGPVQAIPLTGLGRFKHEAACVDPRTGIVYLTEDTSESLLYRFIPDAPGELAKGGKLQALGLAEATEGGDTRNWSGVTFAKGDWKAVRWIDLDGVDNPDDDLAKRGHAAGAALFARGEGIFWGKDELYFTCTSGGAAKLGQIMRYVPSPREGQPDETAEPGRLQNFVESSDPKVLFYADNIIVAPWGHLIACEDNYTDETANHIKGVTPDGRTYTIGRNAFRDNAEFAGACFSPDGQTLFVNIYWPGITLAITGPWAGLKL
ncbi:MAG: alkaline phosphatase PhoX [Caulobacter sp.]